MAVQTDLPWPVKALDLARARIAEGGAETAKVQGPRPEDPRQNERKQIVADCTLASSNGEFGLVFWRLGGWSSITKTTNNSGVQIPNRQ